MAPLRTKRHSARRPFDPRGRSPLVSRSAFGIVRRGVEDQVSSDQHESDPVDPTPGAGESKAEVKPSAADDGKEGGKGKEPEPWWKEITQPFVDLIHAPRALWGINAGNWLEGMCYFGVIGYLAMYFNQYVGLSDQVAGWMVGVLTAGITLSMFFFGGLADRWGVRTALLAAFVLLVLGRVALAAAPSIGSLGGGLFSVVHLVAMGGILLVVLGYGMYMPATYAGVRQFCTPKAAGMGYAMLYALMNLGGWLPTFFPPVRRAVGISGSYWVYAGITLLSLLLTFAILTPAVAKKAIALAKAAKDEAKSEQEKKKAAEDKTKAEGEKHRAAGLSFGGRVWHWLKNHPLADAKFSFFIFCLIPVQTLFAHNWLTLPMYVARAYRPVSDAPWELLVGDVMPLQFGLAAQAARAAGNWSEVLRLWIGENFEVATNFNPIMIFVLVPMVAALTQKRKVYSMMILGTFVMAVPTFLLALGTSFWTLFAFLVLMTVGEAMWQPRFLQYAAEIAPEGRTAAYMGVAQFPWFLTKMLVPLYSGWFLSRYVPAQGEVRSEAMWLIYGAIAMTSTMMLIMAKGWVGKDFKTKA
jgi:POT family proton-dependent oligopeptide transporter